MQVFSLSENNRNFNFFVSNLELNEIIIFMYYLYILYMYYLQFQSFVFQSKVHILFYIFIYR